MITMTTVITLCMITVTTMITVITLWSHCDHYDHTMHCDHTMHDHCHHTMITLWPLWSLSSHYDHCDHYDHCHHTMITVIILWSHCVLTLSSYYDHTVTTMITVITLWSSHCDHCMWSQHASQHLVSFPVHSHEWEWDTSLTIMVGLLSGTSPVCTDICDRRTNVQTWETRGQLPGKSKVNINVT